MRLLVDKILEPRIIGGTIHSAPSSYYGTLPSEKVRENEEQFHTPEVRRVEYIKGRHKKLDCVGRLSITNSVDETDRMFLVTNPSQRSYSSGTLSGPTRTPSRGDVLWFFLAGEKGINYGAFSLWSNIQDHNENPDRRQFVERGKISGLEAFLSRHLPNFEKEQKAKIQSVMIGPPSFYVPPEFPVIQPANARHFKRRTRFSTDPENLLYLVPFVALGLKNKER